MRKILAFEIEPQPWDRRGHRSERRSKPHGPFPNRRRQPFGAIERRGASGEVGQQPAQLGPEDRVIADRQVGFLELFEGGHQGLGDISAAEVAFHPPSTKTVGVEQAGVERGRAIRQVRPVVPRGTRPLGEDRDAKRVLGRALTGLARSLDAGGDIDADSGDRAQGADDVRRIQAPGQKDG